MNKRPLEKPLTDLTIEEVAQGLEAGDFSSVEVTQACLQRIKDTDRHIHAYVRVEEELALTKARESDERRAKKMSRGILDGVPYSLKDVYATKDSPTTASSKILTNWTAPYDATVYTKLNAAGAVLLGKTNTDEFTMGTSTETSYQGVTRNPWNTEKVSGGSSGGPAACIAAKQAIFSIGTDTGGSIRQPAAFCGVTGVRPTYGRISRFGEIAMASSLDQTGPITKTVRDAAILTNILSGKDPLDATSSPESVPDFVGELEAIRLSETPEGATAERILEDLRTSKPLNGFKVGIAEEYFGGSVDSEVEERVFDAVRVLEELGASIVKLKLPTIPYALAAYYIIAPAEVSSNMARYDGIRYGYSIERELSEALHSALLDANKVHDLYQVYALSRAEGLGAEVERRIMLGTHVLSAGYYDAYYKKAEAVRSVVAREFEQTFTKVDVLVAPVTPHPAFSIGEKINDPLAMYKEDVLTVPLNIGGIPGMSVPCGFVRGLPVGLQVMAGKFQESKMFAVAHAYQLVTDYHTEYPKLTSTPTRNE